MSTTDRKEKEIRHGKSAQGVTLVIGATGHVGRHVVSQLLSTGASVRALTRQSDSAGLPAGIEVVRGDLTAPDTLDACAKGIDAVYLVWPFLPTELARAALKALTKHARRIVFQSSFAVRDDLEQQPDPVTAFHADIEHLIEQSGLSWTFLRCGGFATNTLQWAPQIRAEGVVRWPYGACARSLIHERDIAAVGVEALTRDGHGGAKYVLTGPRSMTQIEQVRTIGEAIGRPLRYEEISPEATRQQLLTQGWPSSFVDAALDYWAKCVMEPELVSPTVEKVTGAPARTFREWAIDHAADFR